MSSTAFNLNIFTLQVTLQISFTGVLKSLKFDLATLVETLKKNDKDHVYDGNSHPRSADANHECIIWNLDMARALVLLMRNHHYCRNHSNSFLYSLKCVFTTDHHYITDVCKTVERTY